MDEEDENQLETEDDNDKDEDNDDDNDNKDEDDDDVRVKWLILAQIFTRFNPTFSTTKNNEFSCFRCIIVCINRMMMKKMKVLRMTIMRMK